MFASTNFKNFGECIKKIRLNANYTQKHVSELSGIHIDTIRRIENAFVIPKYETLELLSVIYKFDLTKLLIKSRNENNLNKLYLELERVLIGTPIQKSILLAEFNKLVNDINLNTLVNQNEATLLKTFIYATEIIHSDASYDCDLLIHTLVNSLKQSIPFFEVNRFSEFCYSELELRIMLLLALVYQDKGESSKSIPIFDFCLNYLLLTTDDDALSSIKMKIKIYYNLSYAYYKIEDDKNSLNAANLGIKLCNAHKSHYFLEMLLARKAVAELYLKDENYMNTFKDALFLLYALGEHQQIEYLVSKTKEKHGIDLSSITAAFY
ncbi:helix-turn-helix domain-containing protein [Fusibacter bizertensis]